MVRFVLRRVLGSLVTLLLVATIAFFAVNLLLPYDYAVGVGGRPGAIAAIREQLGLGRPLWVRWLDYLWNLVRGDLGTSLAGGSVTGLVWGVLPITVAIFAVGGIVAYLLGEWFGRWVAWSRNRLLKGASSAVSVLAFTAFPPWLVFLLLFFASDRLSQIRSFFGLTAVPARAHPGELLPVVLATGLLAALVAGILLRGWARRGDHRILALGAMPACLVLFAAILTAAGLWDEGIDRLLWPSAAMATIALVIIAFGESMLVMRAGVSAEMAEDYVFTARAKGVPGRLIRDRHIARNAVLPVISRLITSVPYLISGLIIIERQLSLDGVASLFFRAIESADVPVILGILVVVGLIGLALRIVLDAVEAVLDPRVRIEGQAV
jgi:peptide/nickel transport system permease protein